MVSSAPSDLTIDFYRKVISRNFCRGSIGNKVNLYGLFLAVERCFHCMAFSLTTDDFCCCDTISIRWGDFTNYRPDIRGKGDIHTRYGVTKLIDYRQLNAIGAFTIGYLTISDPLQFILITVIQCCSASIWDKVNIDLLCYPIKFGCDRICTRFGTGDCCGYSPLFVAQGGFCYFGIIAHSEIDLNTRQFIAISINHHGAYLVSISIICQATIGDDLQAARL
ncbi:Uncharacterised protein [Yersinia pseudotuberculosis]|nr:Uncharacterised protein [Yersinia pseudotuberculosis]